MPSADKYLCSEVKIAAEEDLVIKEMEELERMEKKLVFKFTF